MTAMLHLGDGEDNPNNTISVALVVEDESFGNALRLHLDGIATNGYSTDVYLDADNAKRLMVELFLMVVKLNQIGELRPTVS